MTGSHDCNDRLLALLGNDSELDLAVLNVKDRVCKFSLGEDNLIPPVGGHGLSLAHLGENVFWIKCGFDFLPHRGLPFSFLQGLPFPPARQGEAGMRIGNSNSQVKS
jgi:hypothetical protein